MASFFFQIQRFLSFVLFFWFLIKFLDIFLYNFYNCVNDSSNQFIHASSKIRNTCVNNNSEKEYTKLVVLLVAYCRYVWRAQTFVRDKIGYALTLWISDLLLAYFLSKYCTKKYIFVKSTYHHDLTIRMYYDLFVSKQTIYV